MDHESLGAMQLKIMKVVLCVAVPKGKRKDGKEVAQAAHVFELEVIPVEELRHGALVNLHHHFGQCELALRA